MIEKEKVKPLLRIYNRIPKIIEALNSSISDLDFDEEILSLSLSHSVNDLPRGNSVGNKTANIAENYQAAKELENENIKLSIFSYKKIQCQLDIGLALLTEEEKYEIDQLYILSRPFKDVCKNSEKKFGPCSSRQRYRRISKSLSRIAKSIYISELDLKAIENLI